MSDNQRSAWLLIAAVSSPIILLMTIVLDIGGDRQRLKTVIDEVALIRYELRDRARDRIYRAEHDRDINILLEDINGIRSRITRNEAWIFGDESKWVSP